ncbi:hypothetical protein HDU67_005969, partial [Dinochytrium kinnereticum]
VEAGSSLHGSEAHNETGCSSAAGDSHGGEAANVTECSDRDSVLLESMSISVAESILEKDRNEFDNPNEVN